MRRCTVCEIEYPLDYFSPNKYHKDGLQSRCKKCNREYQQKYRQTEHGKNVRKKQPRKYRKTINGRLRIMYSNIKQRCNNSKNKRYKDYGGRGIENRFKSPDGFVDYVVNILKVNPIGLQIDRINNDGHYEKGNIRFVTAKENSNNRRK